MKENSIHFLKAKSKIISIFLMSRLITKIIIKLEKCWVYVNVDGMKCLCYVNSILYTIWCRNAWKWNSRIRLYIFHDISFLLLIYPQNISIFHLLLTKIIFFFMLHDNGLFALRIKNCILYLKQKAKSRQKKFFLPETPIYSMVILLIHVFVLPQRRGKS